jgi:dTMP kinase
LTLAHSGVFLVLDGIDGCGKSTQAAALTRAVKAHGREVVHVREPGSTPFGEALRSALLDPKLERGAPAEILTFFASRAELLRQAILPVLARDAVVVCERWVPSTFAYQAAGSGEGLALVEELERLVIPRNPDAVFILDLTPAQARARLRRPLDGIEGRGDAYFARVREGFLDYGRRHSNVVVVDAGAPVDEISKALWSRVAPLLG